MQVTDMLISIIGYKKVRADEPVYAPTKREEDACYDLFASISTVIQPGQIVGVQTNLIIDFPAGWEGKIEEKSGLSLKKGVHVLGGVIDHGYTGEIIIIIHNIGKTNINFEPGHKVAQLKIREVSPHWNFVETVDVKTSQRGSGGFGSTGV